MTPSWDLTTYLAQFGWPTLAIIARISAIFSMMPVFGDALVPMRFRLAIGVVFGATFAFQGPSGALPENPLDPSALLIREITIGVCIGLGFRVIVHALQTCATIAAQSFAVSQMAGAINGEPIPAVGYFLFLSSMALLLTLGFGEHLVGIIQRSFILFPLGADFSADDISYRFVTLVEFSFDLAVQLAIPFCAVSLFYNVVLGAANKVMPQLMVMLVGAPVGMLAMLVMLGLTVPLIATTWSNTIFDIVTLNWIAK